MPAPVSSIAHLLGRASPTEKTKNAKLRKQKQASDRGVAESIAASAARTADFKAALSVIMEKPAAAAKKAAAKSPPKSTAKAPPRKTSRHTFAHLAPAPFEFEDDDTAPPPLSEPRRSLPPPPKPARRSPCRSQRRAASPPRSRRPQLRQDRQPARARQNRPA